MRQVTISGADFTSIEEVHDFLAGELDFPSYYGKNLSALYDVLTETDLETEITVDLTGMDEGRLKESLRRMASVISDATGSNEAIQMVIIEA